MIGRTCYGLAIAVALAVTPGRAIAQCCTAGEVATLRDLTYIAKEAGAPAAIGTRLVVLADALAYGTYRQWQDADRGLILGYMASTPDGIYWRGLINSFGATLGVSVKPVGPSVPPPPAPAPLPPPNTPVPAPQPTTGTIPGLTAAQIGAANDALYAGRVAGRIEDAPFYEIEGDLISRRYALIVNKRIIDIIKGWYYGGATQLHRDALHPLLAIYDQRVPGTDDLLQPGDPRIQRPSSTVVVAPVPPAPAPVGPSPVVPAPVGGVTRLGNVVISGILAIGMEPDPRADARIQIGSPGSAEILMRSSNTGANSQNPGYASDVVVSSAWDGGLRLIQGGYWGPGGFVKSAPNRDLNILALDSRGTFSYSKERKDGTDGDRSQHFVIMANPNTRTIDFISYKAGWKIRLLESNSTNAADVIAFPRVFSAPRGSKAKPKKVKYILNGKEIAA